VDVFVVDFMRSSHSFSVARICIAKPFKALVDEYIMYHKVGKTIGEYAQSNRQARPKV
jgi:hypothetical protein